MTASHIQQEDEPLRDRISANPRPAVLWSVCTVLFVGLEFGALAGFVMSIPWNVLPAVPGGNVLASIGNSLADLPTLLSRDLIPNQGYWNGTSWHGTFLGFTPASAWGVRLVLIYLYGLTAFVLAWWGYRIYRENYRYASWTPRDDMVDRLRGHSWSTFGLVIVSMFVIMAVFAPALGPTTVEQNIKNPYSYEVTYWNEDSASVQTTTVGTANLQSKSTGTEDQNVGPMSYDKFDRWHPFGTLDSGKDLFTFMAAGARVSLFIGLLGIAGAGFIAVVFSLLTAYYKGLVDILVVLASDSVMSLPQLMIMILLSVVFAKSWIGKVYNGGLILMLIFAATYWPYLWRTLRGPSMQVSEKEWVDAARSFGQKPRTTMRKHMLPYTLGYLLVYGSMNLGGIIIAISALSFLGIGVNAPTPEWGRAVAAGQNYVTTSSWHISLIPGVLIVFVVTAFNALGDGIRDAIDPKSNVSGDDERASSAEATAAGGGGA